MCNDTGAEVPEHNDRGNFPYQDDIKNKNSAFCKINITREPFHAICESTPVID